MQTTLIRPDAMPSLTVAAARAVGATKRYGSGDTAVTALDDVTVDFRAQEFTAIMGPSGSGKSTLMHNVAGLDTLTSGSVYIGDTELSKLDDKRLTQLRRDKVGFIFQAFNLIPTLTALENITLPMSLAGRKADPAWLDHVVQTVGLSKRLGHRPSELSGGQQQRVAVARALAGRPEIIFGDEPTGNLDSRTGAEILSFMRSAVQDLGQTIVMVTHDPVAASYAQRVLFLADGAIVDEMSQPTAERVLDRLKKFGGLITMFRTTLKNLAARKLRLLTTSIAVMLGVAFMAGTLVLTATLDESLSGTVAGANAGTDVNVRGELAFDDQLMGEQRARVDVTLIDSIRSVPGVAAAEGHIEAFAQVVDKDGNVMGDPNMGAPVLGGEWLADETLNPFHLTEGRAPEGEHEVVLDDATASDGGFVVGDELTVLTEAGPQAVTVAGIAALDDDVSLGGAQVTMFSPTTAQAVLTEPGKVDAVKVLAANGVDQRVLADRVEAVVPDGMDVLTGAELIQEEQDSLKEDMAFFNTFLLAFAVIALFVGSFIIYNSFSILVAQRTKEMALMRAIGAGRRQVMGAVVLEAAVVGLIASVVGLVAGIGVAAGLQAMLAGMGVDLPSGGVVVTNTAVIASVVAGLGVSVASSVLPARRASKIAPVAAMRDVALDTSASSKRRVVTGSAVTLLGALAMAAGLFGDGGVGLIGLGAPVVFIGVAVLGPVLARPISRVIGAPLPTLKGMSGTIARENAMRNPKRTSATAAALMIGVALVGMITILASSTKASIDETIQEDFHGDLVIASESGMGTGGLSTDVSDRLQELPELDAVTGYRLAAAEIDGGAVTSMLSADPAVAERIGELRVLEGSADGLGNGTIAVDEHKAEANGWSVGDVLPVRFAETGVQQLTVGAVYEESTMVGDAFIGLETYDANVADRFDFQVVATAADGVSLEQARAAVTEVTDEYPLAEVQDKDEYAEAQGAKADMILNLMYVLLGLAVFIALLGIANTLALSIFERTRELGLLRAVGMTRSQVRAAVRYEAVIIALLGTSMGLVIGTGFGWAIVTALEGEGLTTFALPVSTLAVLTVVGAFAGVLAAVLPARRAAKLDVLGAIVAD